MTTLNHTRSFGCEIELTGLNITQAAAALRAAGITTWDAVTNSMGPNTDEIHFSDDDPSEDEIRAAWRVVDDGSVSRGCEVVSPILSGNSGLDALRRVVRVLKAAGASVNNSCGFHVHVDARDLEGIEIVNAVSRYARHESVIDGFMAPRRRDDRSRWCHSMTPVAQHLLADGAYSSAQGLQYFVSGRYFKLNVQAFVRHGTLEFRQHAGTLNINKMVNWIIFCVQFVENSRMTPEFLATYKAELQEKRLAKLANILAGWAGWISNYQIHSRMGMEQTEIEILITELRRRYPAFQGIRQTYCEVILPRVARSDIPAVPPPMVLPESPGVFDGLPAATVAYLQSRAAGYASRLRRSSIVAV